MTTNTQQNEFIQSLNGDLTPEQAAQLLELGDMGDTGAMPDNGGAPDASPDAGDAGAADSDAGTNQPDSEAAAGEGTQPNAQQQGAAGEAEPDPANTVILAKDGKHTIPFDRLTEAREQARSERALREAAEERAAAAQRELESLRAQAQARADAGEAPTKTDNQLAAAQAAIDQGVDPGIFGDFSEEALAKGIATLVASQVEARVSKALEPLQAKQATDATRAHYDAIYAAHPDADSIVESKELADWIAAQPSFVRGAYEQVFAKGSAHDVIELFDRFKQATGATQQPAAQAPDPEAVKAAAKAAIANAPAATPASLTDFPGGRPAGLTKAEAMAAMTDGRELLENMEGMSAEQIDELLNRLG